MDINAGAAVLNQLSDMYMGGSVAVETDLSNITDFGETLYNLPTPTQDLIVSGLAPLVTKELFVSKKFDGLNVDIIRERVEYGAHDGVVRKTRKPMPQAVDDSIAYNPAPGESSDPFRANAQEYLSRYYGKRFQWKYEWSEPERWMSGAFLSADGFRQAINQISNEVDNAVTVNIDGLTMGAINASIASTLNAGGSQAVNVLAEYNAGPGAAAPVTAASALDSADFLRFATRRIRDIRKLMSTYSRLFIEEQVDGYATFTRQSDMHVVMLDRFMSAAESNLYSGTFHNEFVKLPLGSTVPAWQALVSATGTPDLKSVSTVAASVDGLPWLDGGSVSVNQSGVLAHIFDRERIGIYKLAMKQTNQPDPEGLKTNYFTHGFGQTIIDGFENGVTIYIADEEPDPEPDPEPAA